MTMIVGSIAMVMGFVLLLIASLGKERFRLGDGSIALGFVGVVILLAGLATAAGGVN